jgi:hypothetical protein
MGFNSYSIGYLYFHTFFTSIHLVFFILLPKAESSRS